MPLDVSALRNYGLAFSDAESTWPDSLKDQMRRDGRAVVLRNLNTWQKLRFGIEFGRARVRARRMDLSHIRARGMNNERFLALQLEYLAMFAALVRVVGSARAVAVVQQVMDETAREALLLCLPEPEAVRTVGDPFDVFRAYFRPGPEAACAAGCGEMVIAEDDRDAFQFDIRWCVWLELARAMGVPEACLPNCYSDDLVFPDYFAALGIRYERTGTLAGGARCCDFRFERIKQEA